MALIIWLLIGLAAGYVAGNLMGATRPYGLVGDMVLGVLGSVAGGFILSLLGFGTGGGIIATFIVALIGAFVLLWLVRKFNNAT